MERFSDETLRSMEELFAFCDRILEEDVSREEIDGMREKVPLLQEETEKYRARLLDQEKNSRSGLSRDLASALLKEDRRIEDLIRGDLPEEAFDVNIGALCVEYLTGRAMQAVREALTGATCLKILSEETEQGM